MTAFVNYNTISEKVDISGNVTQESVDGSVRRRRASASETSEMASEQLEMIELVVSSSVLDAATAQLTIDQLPAITVTDMALADQGKP